ncbi:hypothetical protein BTVI_132129 [Pitangus sulphuratus]|nr:hypothetical protein BTVI_132129 [Pitangus sulphuratus]
MRYETVRGRNAEELRATEQKASAVSKLSSGFGTSGDAAEPGGLGVELDYPCGSLPNQDIQHPTPGGGSNGESATSLLQEWGYLRDRVAAEDHCRDQEEMHKGQSRYLVTKARQAECFMSEFPAIHTTELYRLLAPSSGLLHVVIGTSGTVVVERIPPTFINNNTRFNLIDKTITSWFEPVQKSKPKDCSVFVTLSFDSSLMN